MKTPDLVRKQLFAGLVIPAHPLALTAAGKFDERHQRALTRYYCAAGAGGLAVAVHTTQFQIRDPPFDLLRPVLELTMETARDCRPGDQSTIMIAGICGLTQQALSEARLARELGYDAGLLSLAALPRGDDDELIEHCSTIAAEIPILGFYLQPAVGGRLLSVEFWRRFIEIENVVGIKVSPFDRYKTLDVVRALADVGRTDQVALYTGNDDAIVSDLVSEYRFDDQGPTIEFCGGLLGHWACWTRAAVDVHRQCQAAKQSGSVPSSLMRLAAQVTDCNAALFDARNHFAGCIAGIQTVLFDQGLLSSDRLLDPQERLSSGQREAIERVRSLYPYLTDDAFVQEHRDEWLR
ncbi:dihydrodipicolinate synthase family protein [Roseiconus lacunae]|uniref:dihydrodipicolinate synthase family protein n=1 Tax=Roseiconus lacunae TaxID=2605694 RepID=UPI001E623DE3|nr:dihydrodipicolinate synthase family protein [Roseiconus lacunae]MCD0461822.1 dihydrodipicolinate synthase family protein [Roseiconus lacunae]